MTYIPSPRSGITRLGHPFNITREQFSALRLPPTKFKILDEVSVKHFVFVTACSDHHFNESIDAVASVQKHFPDRHIIYYDIGLREFQRQAVICAAGVESRINLILILACLS